VVRFNPRAREGRDTLTGRASLPPSLVSIHAPVKGATLMLNSALRWLTCFNPRAREGRDPASWRHNNTFIGFNPRAREGRDPEGAFKVIKTKEFQSTRP